MFKMCQQEDRDDGKKHKNGKHFMFAEFIGKLTHQRCDKQRSNSTKKIHQRKLLLQESGVLGKVRCDERNCCKV